MARYFTQTLIKLPLSSTSKLSPLFSLSSSSSRLFASKAQLIELDLDSSSSSTDGAGAPGDVEVMGLKRLDDAIHSIIVRRLAPDWLPFRPGSSYWVPPKQRKAGSILEVLGKLTNPLTHEQALSVSSTCGWPSSSYFCEGSVSEDPIPMEVEVQVHEQGSTDKSISEDE